jgi:hypothetical protein
MCRALWCRRRAGLVLALLVSAVAGCSSSPRVVRVTGTVKHGGKPLSNVQVRFIPEQGRPSIAITDDNGRFELDYARDHKGQIQKGAIQGTHNVLIAFAPRNAQEEMKGFAKPPDAKAILEKYGDPAKPQLKFEIKDDGQDIDVNLD